MAILVFNAGSSSLKFGRYSREGRRLSDGQIDWPEGAPLEALDKPAAAGEHGPVEALGHRVVHGGTYFQASTRVDERVKAGLRALTELAPLHNPRALAVIEACEKTFPGVPQVAVFDTAFFSTLPPRQIIYPVPYAWFADWGIRRFGFHGISHAYCSARVRALMMDGADSLRLVICHLGRGCSAAAVRGGRPVATTMGFTPLEGLMMGTRSGSLDPGILLYLERRRGVKAQELEEILNKQSGLDGVSGVSSDVRDIQAAAEKGHERARLALDMFIDRVRSGIGALAVTLGGIDALVFAGGIGEHSASVREQACQGLECLGVRLDPARNKTAKADAEIAAADSAARIWVIETREDDLIARQTAEVVGQRTP